MRKPIIKLICAVILTAVIFSITVSANNSSVITYNLYSQLDDVQLLQSNNQSYLVGTKNNKVYIDAVYPSSYSITLSLSNKINCYNIFDDNLVFICPNNEYDQTQVVIYNISEDSFEYLDLTHTYIAQFNDFVLISNNLYVLKNQNEILSFSTNGKLLKTYNSKAKLTSLLCDHNKTVFATSTDGLYRINQNSLQCVSYGTFFAPCVFASNEIFIDDVGSIYKIKGSTITNICNYGSSTLYPCTGVYGEYVFTCDNNNIYAIDKNTGNKKKIRTMSNIVEQFCVINDKVISLGYINNTPTVYLTPFSDFTDIKDYNLESNSITTTSISSDTYLVDNSKYRILNIPHSTTVAKFKKNMNYEGYNVEFTRYDGKVLKSGNVGTATIARFYNDHASYEYELSVIGDLTGEGNVNRRDRDLIFECVLDNVKFDGVYFESANLHAKDNRISIADVVMLLRLIASQK